jgi:hypothetical protein
MDAERLNSDLQKGGGEGRLYRISQKIQDHPDSSEFVSPVFMT